MSTTLQFPDNKDLVIDWEGLSPEGAWVSIELLAGIENLGYIILDDPSQVDELIETLLEYKEKAWKR